MPLCEVASGRGVPPNHHHCGTLRGASSGLPAGQISGEEIGRMGSEAGRAQRVARAAAGPTMR
jgi:hypothetical protein